MTEDSCPCCGESTEQVAESKPMDDRWLDASDVLDAQLPDDLRSALDHFLGGESIDTLGDWVAAVRRHSGGGAITVDELCHVSGATDHWATMDGDRFDFACFFDAVILAALAERPVEIRTQSPDGTVIEARADGSGELTVTPSDVVVSFGIDDAAVADADGGDPTLETGYAAICPYVRAFPTTAAYERWAATVPAPTVALSLAASIDLATALVE